MSVLAPHVASWPHLWGATACALKMEGTDTRSVTWHPARSSAFEARVCRTGAACSAGRRKLS